MNSNRPNEILQTGFRVALGGALSLLELLGNSQKRQDNITQSQQELEQIIQDLAKKGELLEREALNFVETLLPQPNPNSKSPDYIERASEQCFRQPFDIKGTNLYGFVLEGSLHKLQQLCDKYLNNPANGKVHYRPATHYIILTFGTLESLSSRDQPDRDRGYIDEQEVVIWMLTMAGQQIGPVFKVDRMAWFVPYIFVSNSPALVSGREVYGIPKELGGFQIPPAKTEPELFTLHAHTWKTLTAQTEAKWEKLIEVSHIKKNSEAQSPKIWATYNEAVRDIAELLLGDNNTIEVPGLGLPIHLLEYLIEAEVPVVMLKQFRDAEDGKKACYQAILEIPMKLSRFRGGRLLSLGDLSEKFKVSIYNFASHPIVSELGLVRGQLPAEDPINLPVKLAFELNFDFTVEDAKVIWKASDKSNCP
ncbi:MAG: acetoacetate decarboxylase family protein [Microcoleus vaginatus WJT46-NPBG5]|jgi:hypothetical protein|nr:acetoacetate decarboxylase family protein [Microcoleus vaginatus WJT46-NPBG5]